MGNILSGEEKTSRQSKETRGKTLETWTDEKFGYPHISEYPSRRGDVKNRKFNFSFHGRYEKSDTLKPKSHSLDAIIEELYLSGSEESPRDREKDFKIKKPFIPRIKLTRSVSSLKEEKRYKKLFKMSAQPEMHHAADSENSTQSRSCLTNENNSVVTDPGQLGRIYSKNDDDDDDVTKKPDENYFTKNFDECMKRLQLIEKEHEIIEKDVDDAPNIELYFLREKPSSGETNNLENDCEASKEISSEGELEKQRPESENFESSERVSALTGLEKGGSSAMSAREAISEWYNNLKQQFEKSEEEIKEQKAKEMSCRITGATLKNSNESQKPDNKEKDTRHYFSRLVKSNKSLIDEELPDPDKVKNIRAMFQENLNSTLKRKLNKKLGGSLQNIDVRTAEQQMARPLSAQCNRDEIVGDLRDHENLKEKQNKNSELKDSEKEFQIEATKKKLFEKYEKELKIGRDLRGRKSLQQKWTDTGSMSSGVSSDLSSYDTDVECFSREGTEQEPEDLTISDDDLLEEGKDKHYVQNEILEKIRSFGTSVTYYGGEMITCSVGPLLSPTTQAIMEEIGVKYGHEAGGTRSFDEFYRKYVETNEPNRKKKLGRARSFGQNDLFQKPNVLSNREIEIYKNDLEVEIGIKKPSGIPLNGLKPRLVKSNSVGSPSETSEKLETFSQPPVIKIDAATENSPAEDEINAESKDEQENEPVVVEKPVKEKILNPEEEDPPRISIILENNKEIPANEGNKIPEAEEKEFSCERSPSDGDDAPETKTKGLDTAPKEILFGYEKNCLNGKPKLDMEFEEFEVCETIAEKLEKLQELNSSTFRTSVEPNEISTNPVSENPPEVTSKIDAVPKRKWNINLNQETDSADFKTENETSANEDAFNNDKNKIDETFYSDKQLPISENNHYYHLQGNTKYAGHNHSRWPIETTVMVDIQKNNEQTPRLLSNGKTVAKTKIRLF